MQQLSGISKNPENKIAFTFSTKKWSGSGFQFLIGQYLFSFFGEAITLIVFVHDVTFEIKVSHTFTELRTACCMSIVMFNSAPEAGFQLTKLNKFVFIVSLVSLNDVKNYVVVFVEVHGGFIGVEDKIHPRRLQKLEIRVERARVFLVVAALVELRGVQEQAVEHMVVFRHDLFRQFDMTF